MGIVGKAKPLLRPAEQIPIELHIFVFIVEHYNTVVIWRNVMEDDRRLPDVGNGRCFVAEGFRYIFRPTCR